MVFVSIGYASQPHAYEPASAEPAASGVSPPQSTAAASSAAATAAAPPTAGSHTYDATAAAAAAPPPAGSYTYETPHYMAGGHGVHWTCKGYGGVLSESNWAKFYFWCDKALLHVALDPLTLDSFSV